MSKAATKVEVRRVHIGYASVDSGMLMIVDPCYVLKDKYAEKHGWKKGYDPATESDYEKAGEFCHSNTPQFRVVRHEGDKVVIDPKPVRTQFDDAEPLTAEQHKQIA